MLINSDMGSLLIVALFSWLYRHLRQGFDPATQIAMKDECPSAALDGAQRTAADGLVERRAPDACNRARFGDAVSKSGVLHDPIPSLCRAGPGNHARARERPVNMSEGVG